MPALYLLAACGYLCHSPGLGFPVCTPGGGALPGAGSTGHTGRAKGNFSAALRGRGSKTGIRSGKCFLFFATCQRWLRARRRKRQIPRATLSWDSCEFAEGGGKRDLGGGGGEQGQGFARGPQDPVAPPFLRHLGAAQGTLWSCAAFMSSLSQGFPAASDSQPSPPAGSALAYAQPRPPRLQLQAASRRLRRGRRAEGLCAFGLPRPHLSLCVLLSTEAGVFPPVSLSAVSG